MNDLRSAFRVSADTLRGSPLRTFLSTLGIVIGVASLVAILSLTDGVERFIRAEIGEGTDLQVMRVSPRTTRSLDDTQIPRTDTVRFTPEAVQSLGTALGDSIAVGLIANGIAVSTVDIPAGAVQRASRATAPRPTTAPRQHVVRLLAISPGLSGAIKVQAAAGRVLAPGDAAEPRLLLSPRAARALAAPSRPSLSPGDSVRLGAATFAVVGILAGDQWAKPIAAVLPIAVARRALTAGARDWLPALLVRAPRIEAVAPVRAATERWLAARYGAAWAERVEVGANSDAITYVQRGMLLFKLLMAAVTGISLVVGGIGVMNVLLAAVAERTREIGVRRAVGAARGHILAQFLAEAVTISGLGSAAGVALGLGAADGITAVLRARTEAQVYAAFSAETIVVAVVATVAVGLSFGIYPALRAARLDPIDAIRHE